MHEADIALDTGALKKEDSFPSRSILRFFGSRLCAFSAQFHTPPFVHELSACLQFFTNPMFKMML